MTSGIYTVKDLRKRVLKRIKSKVRCIDVKYWEDTGRWRAGTAGDHGPGARVHKLRGRGRRRTLKRARRIDGAAVSERHESFKESGGLRRTKPSEKPPAHKSARGSRQARRRRRAGPLDQVACAPLRG